MTLHVVTDWQISDDFDSELCEVIGRTDARQHQQLRRRDRAGADHDLAVSLRNLFAAAVSELDPVSLRSWIMPETEFVFKIFWLRKLDSVHEQNKILRNEQRDHLWE